MKQTDYTMRVLTPEEGKFLTQAAADIEPARRLITDKPLYLSTKQTPEEWKEITAEEAEALRAEQQAAFEAAEAAEAAAKAEAAEAAEAEALLAEQKASEASAAEAKVSEAE